MNYLHKNFVVYCDRMKCRRTISQSFNKLLFGISGPRAQIVTYYSKFPLFFLKTHS